MQRVDSYYLKHTKWATSALIVFSGASAGSAGRRVPQRRGDCESPAGYNLSTKENSLGTRPNCSRNGCFLGGIVCRPLKLQEVAAGNTMGSQQSVIFVRRTDLRINEFEVGGIQF